MIYTSKDLLTIVIAFCVLWLTIFISWSLYYVAMLLRGAYLTFKEAKQKLEVVDKFIKNITEKVERSANSLQLLVEGFGRLATYFLERKSESKSSAKNRNKKSDE